ncbi:MAG: response regulator transcription factor [Syntrophobacteraceae bacterium]
MCDILLVEDNPTFRRSLREMLAIRFPGAGIEEASNGDEALLMIEQLEPDLVFMDIKLPGRNGLELTKFIKSTRSGIDVIILTSYDIPEYRDAAFRSGASHFFTKGNARSDEIADVVSSAFALKGKICSTSILGT